MALITLREGMRIHLKEKNGMYTVVKVWDDGVDISSKAQIARAGYPAIIPTTFVEFNDIKCLAGGINRL